MRRKLWIGSFRGQWLRGQALVRAVDEVSAKEAVAKLIRETKPKREGDKAWRDQALALRTISVRPFRRDEIINDGDY